MSTDLIYIVKPGDVNEELRHSLRSVAENVTGYRKLWIVGSIPSWVSNVNVLPLQPVREKWSNIHQSLRAACDDSRVADNIVVFNDDFFVLDKVDARKVTPIYVGYRWRDYLQWRLDSGMSSTVNTWWQAVQATCGWVERRGYDARVYEAHTPMPFDKQKLFDALNKYPEPRTCATSCLYPLAANSGSGVSGADVKVRGFTEDELNQVLRFGGGFVSSEDRSFEFGAIGDFIRERFSSPSIFENGG